MKIKDINNRVSNTPDNIREEVTPISTEYISGLFQHQGDESNPLEYYTKSQTYNRQEIDGKITNVNTELKRKADSNHVHKSLSRVLASSNTSAENKGKYTKLATFDITRQYGFVASNYNIIVGGHGAPTTEHSTLNVWIKNQNPLGEDGIMKLTVANESKETINHVDFYLVEVSKTESKNTYELYAYMKSSYMQIAIFELGTYSNDATTNYHVGQPFIDSLPNRRNIKAVDIANKHNHTIQDIEGFEANATDINMSDGTNVEVAITSINRELSKPENTKYQTVNGVKELQCKDGYTDNMVIEGKTLKSNLLTGQTYEIGSISYGQSSGNNEANERAYRTVSYIEIDASKQYKIYTDKLNNTYSPSPYYYFYYDTNKAYITRADSANITPPSNAKYIRFYEHIGEVLTQDRVNNVKCMMFESQDAPPFSPNMDYCEPILASAGDGDKIEILSVKSDGNLFVSDLKQGWIVSGTGIYAPNSGNGNTSNDLFLKVTPNEKYYFNFELNTNKIFNVSIFKYDRNKKYLSSELMGIKSLKGSYTIPQNVEYVKFRFDRTNDGDECLISDFSHKLYFGKQNVDYIPPKYDRKQISTTLRSLPNGVKDVIEKHGNKYLHTARCYGKIIDNSFSPSKLVSEYCSDTVTAFRVTLKDAPKITNLLSSMKVVDERVPNPTYEYISLKYTTGGIGVFDIGIANSKLSSLDNAGATAFLKANPIPIVGQLEVPIVTELPNLNLQTFLNKTTVLINSGSVQADIIFDVTESLGSSVEVMKDKLSSHDEVVSKFKNITFSIELPTDAQGSDGDIWIKYV